MEGVESEPRAEVSRMLALQEAYLACPDAVDCCDLCGEIGVRFTLCMHPPLACPLLVLFNAATLKRITASSYTP